jgi:succinate dehydrogenase subunit C
VTTHELQPSAERDGLVAAPPSRPLKAYQFRQPFNWWTRRRGYVLYMVRELSALPVAIWWLLFLVEVSRLRDGSNGYHPLEAWFVAVSVVCLVAAVWHSYTFLNLAGLIMRIPLGDRTVPARAIVGAAFSGFVVVTAVVAALLIWGGV